MQSSSGHPRLNRVNSNKISGFADPDPKFYGVLLGRSPFLHLSHPNPNPNSYPNITLTLNLLSNPNLTLTLILTLTLTQTLP